MRFTFRNETKIPLSGESACAVKCEAYFTGAATPLNAGKPRKIAQVMCNIFI